MSVGTIHTPSRDAAVKALIAASLAGTKVEIKETAIQAFQANKALIAKFPLGTLPVLEATNGDLICESSAIAAYIASSKEGLFGSTKTDLAFIQQWIAIADSHLQPLFVTLIAPILTSAVPYDAKAAKKALEDLKRVLLAINNLLATRTYAVGERITVADVVLFGTLVSFYTHIIDPSIRSTVPHLNRYFTTLAGQPLIKAVVGEIKMTETVQKPAAPKKEAKPVTSAPKKESKPKAAADDEDDDGMPKEEKPKEKNPLDLLPPSPFVMDAWKRFYSNNETRPDSVDFFWKNFDAEGYSMYKVVYKYNTELTLTFMSSNLIGGFFQRLERARKYAFGSMVVLGEDGNNEIKGYFIFRGQDVPFEVTDAADYDSYSFTKVDTKNDASRKEWDSYIAWDETIEGKKFCDGKIFK